MTSALRKAFSGAADVDCNAAFQAVGHACGELAVRANVVTSTANTTALAHQHEVTFRRELADHIASKLASLQTVSTNASTDDAHV